MRIARLVALAFAVILATAACSGASSPTPAATAGQASGAASAAPSSGTGNAVSIAGFNFQPATITISAGTTVTWTNNDNASHTVTADDGSFSSDRLASGATFSHTFATAGTFTYHCSIHSSMKGTVIVN